MSDEANLAALILGGDLAGAQAALEQMKWTSSRWANAYSAGRRVAFPPAPLPPLAEPFLIPVEGQPVGTMLSGEIHYMMKGN